MLPVGDGSVPPSKEDSEAALCKRESREDGICPGGTRGGLALQTEKKDVQVGLSAYTFVKIW